MTSKTSNTSQKNECLKAIKLLSRNFKNTEKDCFSNIPNIRNDKEFQIGYEIHLTNESNLKKERNKLAQRIRYISTTIKNFKQESRAVKPSQNAVETLKNLMESVESTVSDFKEQHHLKFEELTNDEKLLTKEIEAYEKKIHNWTTSQNNQKDNEVKITPGLSNKNSENSDLLKEVVDFDRYLLKHGGVNGGWEEIDQSLFLKIRNKYKTFQQNYFDELERLIATKDREQILEHEQWYKNFLDLNEAKRIAIKNWRESKKNSKNESVSLAEAEIKLNREIEKELKARTKKKLEQEKFERNRKLNEWKLVKEIQKAKDLEKQKINEKLELEKEFNEKLKQLEVKEKLNELKRQKKELNDYIEMEQFIYSETQKELSKNQFKNDLIDLHQRDLANVKAKMEKLKAKEKEQEEKEKRLERQKERVDVAYDPSRLYKPTSTWNNRVNTPRSGSCGSMATPRIQHLATPSWRQGL